MNIAEMTTQEKARLADVIIDLMGGTKPAKQYFNVTDGSLSSWRLSKGLPQHRLELLSYQKRTLYMKALAVVKNERDNKEEEKQAAVTE